MWFRYLTCFGVEELSVDSGINVGNRIERSGEPHVYWDAWSCRSQHWKTCWWQKSISVRYPDNAFPLNQEKLIQECDIATGPADHYQKSLRRVLKENARLPTRMNLFVVTSLWEGRAARIMNGACINQLFVWLSPRNSRVSHKVRGIGGGEARRFRTWGRRRANELCRWSCCWLVPVLERTLFMVSMFLFHAVIFYLR